MRRNSAVVALVVLCGLAACSSSGSHPAASGSPPTTLKLAPSTTLAPKGPPTIAWKTIHNPVLSDPIHVLKDPAAIAVGSEWVALFSHADRAGVWRVGIARSTDFEHWSDIATLPHDPNIEGEASPDVVRAPDGAYVVTYQSFVHDRAGGNAKIYARTSPDLRTFSAPIRLLANIHTAPGDRVIDPALTYSPAGLLLGYKVGTTDAGAQQHFEIARSTTGTLAGPWTLVGRPAITVYGDTIENYQFLTISGAHYLLATSNQFDRPQLFRLTGNARQPAGWLRWSPPRELKVPQEAWNPGAGITGSTYEHANSAYIVNSSRNSDGYFYLVFSDESDKTAFGSQGRAELGLARGTDLVHWSVPPSD